MKLINKLCVVLALAGISNAVFGYDFTIKNDTNKAITVKVVTLRGSDQTKVIPQDSEEDFIFNDRNCLSAVFVNGQQAQINSSKARCQSIDDFYVSEIAGKYIIRTQP